MDPFFLFLKKPAASIGQTQRTPIFILFLFYLGLAVFFGLTGYLIYLSKTDIQSILLTKISGYSLVEKVLKVIILAPVIEEILFRLLLRFNRNTVKNIFCSYHLLLHLSYIPWEIHNSDGAFRVSDSVAGLYLAKIDRSN